MVNHGLPRASVIIRSKDSAGTIGGVLRAVRSQSIRPQIIVVDSGSRDRTLAIAHELADRVIEVPADRFSFGGALNVGAAAARGEVHFALSSHSFPPDDHWIERSLAHYRRDDVAGTSGALSEPGSHEPLLATFYQTLPDALRRPWWGFSNTGSSWRARVWAGFPFDEALLACEDKEWGLRVLADGWTIAFDPTLCTSTEHREQNGVRDLYRRTRREYEALGGFASLGEATLRGFLRDWLLDISVTGRYRRCRRRLSPLRLAELTGRYRGTRIAARRGAARSFAARGLLRAGLPEEGRTA